MERKDKITWTLSSTAILVSIGIFVYTVRHNSHLEDQQRQRESENVAVQVKRNLADYDTRILDSGGKDKQLIVQWNGLVSNNGAVPISLIRHDLIGTTQGFPADYTNMDLGLTDGKGAQLAMPLFLSPGQTVPFMLSTGMMLPRPTSDLLVPKFHQGVNYKMNDIRLYAGSHQTDFWGNAVTVRNYGKKNVLYTGPNFSDAVVDPGFLLTFTTARNSRFSANFSYYSAYVDHLLEQAK